MIQYLIILLDDMSVSYCHCDNPYNERRLISIDNLKAGIFYAMKENLMIQFVYPDYELPQKYIDVIDSIDHHDIKPVGCGEADVYVIDDIKKEFKPQDVMILRATKRQLFGNSELISDLLKIVQRLNVVITDLETMTDDCLEQYNVLLDKLAVVVKEEYLKGRAPQFNLLTDRMMIDKPNHCNAGVENITIAPNGNFYLCPAFYYSDPADSVGDLASGLNIKNQQLLRLDHAPLCRHCDAYHCRRCIWLNRKTTLEVNTPSHEQCIVAHTERNAARRLLASIREEGQFLQEMNIPEIDYLDPFDVRKEW